MEHGVPDKYMLFPCFHSEDKHQANGSGPAQIIVGKTQLLEDWCWVFSVVHAQIGARSYIYCEFSAAEQTADHIILACLTHCAPTGIHGLRVLDDNTRC